MSGVMGDMVVLADGEVSFNTTGRSVGPRVGVSAETERERAVTELKGKFRMKPVNKGNLYSQNQRARVHRMTRK